MRSAAAEVSRRRTSSNDTPSASYSENGTGGNARPHPGPLPQERGKHAQFPDFSRPLLWNCFMATHVGGYHHRSALRHLRAGGFEDPALALVQALDAMRGDLVADRIDFLADKIGASGHFRRDILPSPQERAPRSAHFGRRLRAA